MIKNKTLLLMAVALFGGTCATQAQSNYQDDEPITVTNKQGKREVIDLPEGMTDNIDSLLSLYNTRTYLKPDTSCDMPDVNPIYSDSVYKERLKRLPTVIEMPYNDVVRKFIDKYSGKLRRSVANMLGAENFYIPIFEQALETYELPLELKYLPVIESGLNPKAVSRVGATGLWQFMLSTAKRYGLEVNSLVDERRDPVKASYAAAKYLSDLYKIYGDWNLVIAAYNAGPDKINSAIHRAKGETDYWQIYPYLPQETRGYVPAFIAANYIMTYYCDHNICPMITDLPVKCDTVMVNQDINFAQISHVIGIDEDQLEELNPQYRRNIVNGNNKPSALRLPCTYISKFIDNEPAIFAYAASNLPTKRTEVEINEATPTYTGRTYSRRSRKSSRRTRRRVRAKSVKVRSGDTLSEIAARNHTTVSKLKRLNRISGSNIRAGKKIRVK